MYVALSFKWTAEVREKGNNLIYDDLMYNDPICDDLTYNNLIYDDLIYGSWASIRILNGSSAGDTYWEAKRPIVQKALGIEVLVTGEVRWGEIGDLGCMNEEEPNIMV